MKTAKTTKIRTSARQAAARQRIRQIDNPSGSAPPFEQGAETSRWIINPGRYEERRLLETMIQYLTDDPSDIMDASVLRFVYKEWPLLAPSMNTKTTVRNVKKRLQAMDVDFIHRTPDNDWLYWNDYSIEGIFAITSPPDKQGNMKNIGDTGVKMSQLSDSEDTDSQDGIDDDVDIHTGLLRSATRVSTAMTRKAMPSTVMMMEAKTMSVTATGSQVS